MFKRFNEWLNASIARDIETELATKRVTYDGDAIRVVPRQLQGPSLEQEASANADRLKALQDTHTKLEREIGRLQGELNNTEVCIEAGVAVSLVFSAEMERLEAGVDAVMDGIDLDEPFPTTGMDIDPDELTPLGAAHKAVADLRAGDITSEEIQNLLRVNPDGK